MRATVIHRYGSPDVLKLEDIPPPDVADGEVLVRVRAASAHPGDWHLMRGKPYLLRVMGFGLRKPKSRVAGTDVAGTVEAVGANVTRFSPGDEVFGSCNGAFAEYVGAGEGRFARKPAKLTFEQAATVPASARTALAAIRDLGELRGGQTVLVIGASGGVGTFAVQLAKAFGAQVTGVCSARNVDLVRSIGADHVVDYNSEDFARAGRRYDLIVDAVGNRSVRDCRRALAPDGTLVLVGGKTGRFLGGVTRFLQALAISPFVSQRLRPLMPGDADPAPDLDTLRELVEAGKLMPVVDRTYELSEVPEAIRYLERGHARGKVAISV